MIFRKDLMYRICILLALVVIPFVNSGCTRNGASSFSRKSENVATRHQVLEAFDHLELSGNFSAMLKESSTYSLSISADKEVMSLLLLEVEEGVLVVSYIGEQRFSEMPLVELIVNAPGLKYIECSGSVELLSDSTLGFDTLRVESAGVLKMNLDLKGILFEGQLSGASTLDLKGEVKELKLEVPGAAKISAFDLIAQKVTLDMAGAGKAQVCATQLLSVNLAGAGMVSYKGSPDRVFSNISGIGRVKKVE
jgi:hypothetical protein